DEVGLASAGRQRDDTEAHDVVSRRPEGGAHLDGTAGQAPLVDPEAVLPGLVEQESKRLGHVAVLDYTHRSTCFRHAYTRPRARITMKIAISTSPKVPRSSSRTAQGKMNTTSTSNITKSRAKM